jgi:hypothetical protein
VKFRIALEGNLPFAVSTIPRIKMKLAHEKKIEIDFSFGTKSLLAANNNRVAGRYAGKSVLTIPAEYFAKNTPPNPKQI